MLQGDTLAPFIFAIAVVYVIRNTIAEKQDRKPGSGQNRDGLGDILLNASLIWTSPATLRPFLTTQRKCKDCCGLGKTAEEWALSAGLGINKTETEYMTLGHNGQDDTP